MDTDKTWSISTQNGNWQLRLLEVPSWKYRIRYLFVWIVGDRCCRWFRGWLVRPVHSCNWLMDLADDNHEVIALDISEAQARLIAPRFVSSVLDDDDDDDDDDEETTYEAPPNSDHGLCRTRRGWRRQGGPPSPRCCR